MSVKGGPIDRRTVGNLPNTDRLDVFLRKQLQECLLEQLARALDSRVYAFLDKGHTQTPFSLSLQRDLILPADFPNSFA